MKTDLQITLDNLKIVLDKLPKLAEQHPEIKREFDMLEYGCYAYTNKMKKVCKTYGCLLGNMARVLPVTEECYDEFDKFSYYEFGLLHFPYINGFPNNTYGNKSENWKFLFSGGWADFQPTFGQAIERVKYFIDCEGEIGAWEYRKESFIK